MVKPKKKQQPKNALYYFADIEVRKQLRLEGRTMPGIQELIQIAHPRFQQLPEEEQLRWKKIATKEKDKLRADMTNVFTATGQTVAALMQEKEDEMRSEKRMKNDITTTIKKLTERGALLKEKFFVLDFNTYVVTEEDPKEYVPAEMSVVEFSLEKGITRKFHDLIRPGRIPAGYMAEAMSQTDGTHRLKMNSPSATSNYIGLIIRLRNFINPGEKKEEYPPFYVMPENVEKCTFILEWLYERSDDNRRIPFKVYDLPFFLFSLQFHSPKNTPDVQNDLETVGSAICEELLQRSTFDYTEGIECEWHKAMAEEDEDLEVTYCIQSKVISKVYLFLDSACPYYDIKLVANEHCPEKPKERPYTAVGPKAPRPEAGSKGAVSNEWQRHSNGRSEDGDSYSYNASESTAFDDLDSQLSLNNYKGTHSAALGPRQSNFEPLKYSGDQCDTSSIASDMSQCNYNSTRPQKASAWGMRRSEPDVGLQDEAFPSLPVEEFYEMKVSSKAKSKQPKTKSNNQANLTAFSDFPALTPSAGRGVSRGLLMDSPPGIRTGPTRSIGSLGLTSSDFPALGSHEASSTKSIRSTGRGSRLEMSAADKDRIVAMGRGRGTHMKKWE